MALRFPADHCISNSIVRAQQNTGHEVVRLREVLPVDSSAAIVIAKAQVIGSILLSLNGDFADIVTYPPKRFLGIVAVQMRSHSEILPLVMKRPTAYLEHHPNLIDYNGKLLVVDADRIRIRE